MPPRTRRLVAQQGPEEEEQASSSSMNSSLRSFFPLEVVNLIFRELDDPPSLAAVCLVSFGCLEEASGELYRNVHVRSERGLISYTCGVHLRPLSRLIPHLSLNQTRTITIHPLSFREVNVLPFFVEKRGVTFPPRLATPIHLDCLTIESPPAHQPDGILNPTLSFDFYLTFALPHLRPTHVNINAGSPPNVEVLFLSTYQWMSTLRAWSDSLRSISFDGWLPCLSIVGTRYFLFEHLPNALTEVEINVGSWPPHRIRALAERLAKRRVLELVGVRTKVVVPKSEEQLLKDKIAKLDDEQRGRVELVAV